MWVRFVRDFDFSPAERKGRVTIAYKDGTEKNVTQECADQAIAAGAATLMKVTGKRTVGKG